MSLRSIITTRATTLGVVAIFSSASIFMVAGNKVLIRNFPYPNTLILIQNALSLVFAALACHGQLTMLSPSALKYWIPTVVLAALVMMSSLKALIYLNVTTIMILRNFTPIVSTIFEYYVYGTAVSPRLFMSLGAVFVGTVLYGATTVRFDPLGMYWMGVNVACVVAETLVNRFLVHRMSDGGMSMVAMMFNKNALSIPLFMTLAMIDEVPRLKMPAPSISLLMVLSGAMCSVLGSAGWNLQRAVSATSFLIVGSLNKIIVIMLGMFYFQDSFGSCYAFLGCGISLCSIFWYSYERSELKSQEKEGALVKLSNDTASDASGSTSHTALPSAAPAQRSLKNVSFDTVEAASGSNPPVSKQDLIQKLPKLFINHTRRESFKGTSGGSAGSV